jgi:Spy/CpxP family protein refolding chaperone
MKFQSLVINAMLLLLLAGSAQAGTTEHYARERHSMTGSMHTIHHQLIMPHLIARHQKDLQLSAEQEGLIKDQIQTTQQAIASLEWDVSKRVSQLEELLAQSPVNEEEALHAFNALLELEDSIKRIRFRAMLRINNTLTREQRQILNTLSHER